jgi:hypothetical protein
VLAAVTVSARAGAFSFPEHVVLTHHALSAVESDASAGAALRQVLAELGTYFAGAALSVSSKREAGAFQLAELPGLAGDHAATPRHLVQRWLRGPANDGSCQGRGFTDALTELDVYQEPPSVCMARPANAPNNRAGLLAAVRRYTDGVTLLRSTLDTDSTLMAADCFYVCAAERNADHIRIPGVPIGDAATRVDPPNAALSYATSHAVAVALAGLSHERGERGPRYRAVVLVFEQFALHFAQDGVAAGHIVTPSDAGNMTRLATHDYWSWAGIDVVLPEAACARVLADPLLPAHFPRLREHCLTPHRPVHVRGDHALAEKLVEVDLDDITGELAEPVSEVSLREVLTQASESHPRGTNLRALDAELNATVAALEETASAASACAADWDCPAQRARLPMLIDAVRDDLQGLEALSLWPLTAHPARTPAIERPGGLNLYLRVATGLKQGASGASGATWSGTVGAGGAFAASLKGVCVVLGLDGVVAYADNRPGVGVHGAAAVHWLELGHVSFLNELGATITNAAPSVRVEGYACALAGEWMTDRTSLHAGLLGGLGTTPAAPLGWFVGLGVSATLHAERRRARKGDPTP